MTGLATLFRRHGVALLAVGLVSMAIYAGYLGFHKLFVKVGRTVEKPFSGPARTDPFYVLRRYLQQRGVEVRVVRTWPQPLEEHTTVFWFSDQDRVPRSLKAWLAQGGELWSFSDPDVDFEASSDWSASVWPASVHHGGVEQGAGHVAQDAGALEHALVGGPPSEAARVKPDASTPAHTELNGGAAMGLDPEGHAELDGGMSGPSLAHEIDVANEDPCMALGAGCISFAQFKYGSGRLTLVRRAGLANGQVHRGRVAAQVDALLGLHVPFPTSSPGQPESGTASLKAPKVLMVYPLDAPWFGQLLIEHAPAVLLASFVFVLMVLWRGSLHLGPRKPPRTQPRRQMGEHLDAVGALAARAGNTPLIGAARAELREQLAQVISRSSGRVSAEMNDDALIDAVVEALGVPREQAACALTDVVTGTPNQALEIARAMQALWRQT